MTSNSPALQKLVDEIVKSVIDEGDDEARQLAGAEQVLSSIQDELVRLIGPTGFHAILDRALHRAATRHGNQVRSGPLQRSRDVGNFREDMQSIGDDTFRALAAVLSEMLSLLMRLIGADITAGIIHRAWPGVAPWLTAGHLEDSDG